MGLAMYVNVNARQSMHVYDSRFALKHTIEPRFERTVEVQLAFALRSL